MQRKIILLIILFVCTCLYTINASQKKDRATPVHKVTPLEFIVPKGWPKPLYDFTKNPLTQEGFNLGKKLFYDGKLSKDGNFPCASCHQQFAAFATYDHDLSHGVNDKFSTRNAQGIFNLAWRKNFMWDGGVTHLDLQPLVPITAENEMGETIENVVKKIKADTGYKRLFITAFGDEKINTQRITKALSQFILMMVSSNSKYDKVMRGQDSFNLPEKLGYGIFKAKCESCHKEPLFTDLTYRNNGLALNTTIKDLGRMMITGNKSDSLKFLVPSLRNVQVTSPYMHDGRFYQLQKVFDHYRTGIAPGPTTDTLLTNKIPLSNFEIGQLKAFLFALTDTSFIRNKRFAQ